MSKKKNNQNTKKLQINTKNNNTEVKKTGINSRVLRNKLLYNEKAQEIAEKSIEEDLTLTKQQKFNFESVETEDELDTSFMDKKKKSVKIEKVPPVVVEKYKYPKVFFTILLIIIIGLIGFISYHYISFNHHKVKTVTKEVNVMDDNFVFVGDSITHRYDLKKYFGDELPLVNSGEEGNQTSDILNEMEDRIYRYNPTKVFIMIGTNDLGIGKDKNEIISNIKKIVSNIKEKRPLTEIYLESIYPINNSANKKINSGIVGPRSNDDIKYINEEIKKYCTKKKINYIDIFSKLVNDNSEIALENTMEGLHLTDKGYEVVTKELKKYIRE